MQSLHQSAETQRLHVRRFLVHETVQWIVVIALFLLQVNVL